MTAANRLLETVNMALTDFIEVLKQESTALAGNDADALAALTTQKQHLAQSIGRQWQALLEACQLGADTTFADLRRTPLASAAVDKMELSSKEAESLNQINGKIIEEQIRRTQAAMNILQRASATHNLYGADGLMVGVGKRNRSIDTA